MLTAFKARPIVEFKQRDKSKIESLLAYGDRLLVGLNTGSLRIYRVNDVVDEPPDGRRDDATDERGASPTKTRPVDLLREEEKFSRRPVQQLAIIKEANILLSLSDGYVSVHDLHSYALQERLEKTRGASAFAATSNIVKDPATGIPSIVSRLAVAVKRKILLWSWQDMELAESVSELTLVSTVKSLTWASATKIVAGMDPGFVLADVETLEVSDINKPGAPGDANGQVGTRFGAVNTSGMGYMGMGSWVPKPMATKLQDGELLLAKDVNTLFIDEAGQALDRRQIPWAMAPEALGYSYPYMLALQPPARGGLEVRNPDSLSLLQTLALPNAAMIHVPQPNISLAHAGKGFLVASDRCVWRMGALDYDAQVDELVSLGRYDEAISLLGMLEDTLLKDKVGSLRQIKMMKAKVLFELRKYRESLDIFSDATAPPEAVISLYPRVIAGDLSAIPEKAEEDEEVTQEDEQPTTTASEGKHTSFNASWSRAMFGKFRSEHKKTVSDASSILSGSDTTSVQGKSSEPAPDEPLVGKDLLRAVNELCAFLAQTRVQLQKYIGTDGTLKQPLPKAIDSQVEAPQPPFAYLIIPSSVSGPVDWEAEIRKVAVLVDTTLFRAYMLARPGLAGSLFRLDNFCDPVVVKDKLYENGRYGDLIDFLHGKKMHREALELLAKFGKNEADEEVSPALRGPQRTVGYLQQLPPELIDIILEFAEWPLRINAGLAMEVFLADSENAETLPRHRVLQFLEKIDSKLGVRYLEHIVFELNDLTPDFHQRLIDLYLERLKSSDKKAFANDDDKQQWRERLHTFLKSSAQYNRARAFRLLPGDQPDFYEARAIVLSKMGQHKQALQIYVFQLKDYRKAEEYCNQTYLTSPRRPSSPTVASHHATTPTTDPDDGGPSIYKLLLSLYLSPPPPHKPNWPPALDLLSKHGARLPASSTLDLIPASLPVRQLERYFRGRIRSANSVANEERVVSALRAVEKIAVEAALLLGEEARSPLAVADAGPGMMGGVGGNTGKNRRVVISEDRHCAVCHKRFGGSAIRVYPDNTVVHYGCTSGSVGRGSLQVRKSGWGQY